MVNLEKVNGLIGMVRNLIELTGVANNLTDEKLDQLILQAISFARIECIDEELK